MLFNAQGDVLKSPVLTIYYDIYNSFIVASFSGPSFDRYSSTYNAFNRLRKFESGAKCTLLMCESTACVNLRCM